MKDFVQISVHLIGPPTVAGRVLWIRVCPSFHSSVRKFPRDWLISFFLKMGKMGKMGQILSRIRVFLNLLENLVIFFFWIKFYLVKCYIKHTANIWNSFFTYFYSVFFIYQHFFNISLEVSDPIFHASMSKLMAWWAWSYICKIQEVCQSNCM